MGRGKDSDQPLLNQQGDGDFGERWRFTGEVIVVFTDVGGVSHLPGDRDISDQSLFAESQTMSFFIHCAAVDAGQHEFLAMLLIQVDVRFQRSERTRYLVYDAVDKLIQIEERTDPLGGFLQPEQIIHYLWRLR